MPDRDKTRPWLVEQVKQAELGVAHARRMNAALGGGMNVGSIVMKKPMSELAVAGTLLALADAEWAREAAKSTQPVNVRCEPQKEPGATTDPGPIEQHTGKPIY